MKAKIVVSKFGLAKKEWLKLGSDSVVRTH
jgi:hypothetical protein